MGSKKSHGKGEIAPTRADLSDSAVLIEEISRLIEEAKGKVAVAVNVGLTMLYWQVGKRINQEILRKQRGEYGKHLVLLLADELTRKYGRGWSRRNINQMVRFSEVFPDLSIGQTVSAQLSWSHFKAVIPIEDLLKRDFYVEMCCVEGWSVRTLRKKMDSMLYERTALSKKPDDLIRYELDGLRAEDRISPDLVFKDPYFLDFLGLKDRYVEKDLEDAILRELESFLLELGSGFAFLARQKRIQLDNNDYYIDLLFYHRDMGRLIAIDLKLGDFKAEYKGQMELYLRWLSRYEKKPNEAEPLGIILCSGKQAELVELLELDQSGIHVAEYLTELPPRELLLERLQLAIRQAKARLANKLDDSDE